MTKRHVPPDIFDQVANSWSSWFGSANDLMQCAALLWPRRNNGTVWVALMLRGYALENLLKAIWIANGGKLSVSGEFQRVPGTTDHRLDMLAKRVGLGCDENRRNMLGALSNAILHFGRYPVPKSHTGFAMHSHEDPVQDSLWSPQHEGEFWNLVGEIMFDRLSWKGIRNDSMSQEELDQVALDLPRQMMMAWHS
jgi:hypothetical protein